MMAGIYIPNTKMPEECHYCPMRDSCEESMPLSHRPPDCPLVEVPDHGRLIDADALAKLEVIPSDNWVFRAIEKAPTVIPASGVDE